jgi:hypothetical protein
LIEHVYCTGPRITDNPNLWDDLTVYKLSKEYSLNDYLYNYWIKFNKHLEISAEVLQYQLTFNSYLAAKSPEKNLYLSMGMRKNSKVLNRLSLRVQHTKSDLLEFLGKHSHQYGYYKHAYFPTYFFIYKYLLMSHELS